MTDTKDRRFSTKLFEGSRYECDREVATRRRTSTSPFAPSAALVERVRLAIEAVPIYFIPRRRLDGSTWEVIHDLDPEGPLADETLRIVFEGTEMKCAREAALLQARAVARAATIAAASDLVAALVNVHAVADEARLALDHDDNRTEHILLALVGVNTGDDPRINQIHAALKEATDG